MNVNLRVMRDVNTGFGDGLAAAFEMIAGPAIFGFLGHLLDQKLGIGPVFLLTFSMFVFGYECWKLFKRYNAEMDQHLADMQMARRSPTTGVVPASTTTTDDSVAEPATDGVTAGLTAGLTRNGSTAGRGS